MSFDPIANARFEADEAATIDRTFKRIATHRRRCSVEKIIGALAIAIITCSCPTVGMAQVAETVPTTAYPNPQCAKPDVNSIKPPKLTDGTDAAEVAAYNTRVRAYSSQAKALNQTSATYRSCVQSYVENASREVKRIQDQANADLKRITDHSNAAIDTIQAKIKQAVAELNDLATHANSTAALRTGH
jgi:ElaB/YqjD/DUF883 family membrane-anchored ribosome-binding protein